MELEKTSDTKFELPLRRRGKYAQGFRQVSITTNHYHVKLAKFDVIHIFSIKFNPMINFDNRKLRQQLLEHASQDIKAMIPCPVISGMNIFSVKDPLQDEFEVSAEDYKIAIKKVKTMNVAENAKVLLSFLNNGLRNVMERLNYVEIGRTNKFFNVKDRQEVSSLMMFNGYKANFVLLENGYFLRVDSTKKIVRNQTVLEFIDDFYRVHRDKDKDEKRNLLQNELVTQIVMTNYGKTAYYRIIGMDFIDIDSVSVGEHSTLREYYDKKYQIVIKNMKQPLLKVQNKKKKDGDTYLLPELCLMTGIPENFDEMMRRNISQATIKSPADKKKEIGNLMTELKGTQEIQSLKELGIDLNRNMESINGKMIPIPDLELGDHNYVDKGKQAFFNLFNKPIFASKHNIDCGLIYFGQADVRTLIDTFESTSRNLKVKINIKKIKIEENDKRSIDVIKKMVKKHVQDSGCNVFCIVLPNNLKSQYKAIKASCLIDSNIICQMATEMTLRKKNLQSIATKILLQIIAKRGNTLWVPKASHNINKAMLVAFDSAKGDKGKTVLSMCATINSTFSSVTSRHGCFHENHQKFQKMVQLMLQGLQSYNRRNKSVPQEVIIFHNSSSGDQFSSFNEFFIIPLQKKIEETYQLKQPAVTMVMVNTKTNERFFNGEQNNTRNVDAGTLVNEGLVSKNYDFYLISQSSNRGSTLPNHYRVIHSDSKIEEGRLQELILGQCFNYVNWTGSIKIPGILQYAKKCAKFNAEILGGAELSEDLQNKLYFV